MSKLKILFFALLGIILINGMLLSQVTPTGNIVGKVLDDEGNALPGVAVEADSPKLVGKSSTITDASGSYRLLSLTPGRYTITYSLQGFNTFIREDIVVRIAETVTVNIEMTIGVMEEEITVVGESPLIDVKSTTKGMTISREMFEVLPRGRNFDTLTSAVPGVNVEPWLGGISVDGASSAENMYYIDGVDITTVDVGSRGQSAAFEFVEEVKIVASGFGAEYGGALGGVISVLTRQGGNEFHGEILAYYSGSALTGKERDTLRLNPYDVMKAEYVNYQDMYGKDEINRIEPGFSLGGYILKDKLWFFGSFLPVINPTTRHVEFLSDPPVTGDYTRKRHNLNFQAKITAQPFSFMRIGASFINNFYKYRGSLPARAGTSNPDDVWSEYGFDYPNWTASGFADITVGNNFMINIKGGSFRTDQTNQQVVASEPRWYMTGDGMDVFIGTPLQVPDQYYKVRYWQNHARIYETEKNIKYKSHITADFTYFTQLFGEHSLKFGFSFVRQGEDHMSTVAYPDYPDIYFYWNRDCIQLGQNLGSGEYGYYEVRGNEATGVFGGVWEVHNDRWAIYIQDSWTISDRFTLNLGVRAESEHIPPYTSDLPADVAADFKPMSFDFGEKLAPRVGFTYDVFGDASFKIFGTYALYYDVVKTYSAAHAWGGFKWKSAYYTLDDYKWDETGMGNYPGDLLMVRDHRHVSFDTTQPDMFPCSQREFSFGAEKILMENLSATVRVVQKHLRYTIEDVGVIVYGVGEVYYQCNPGYGYSLLTTNGGKFDPKYPETPKAKREYWGVNFSMEKRLSNNWLAGFSYTWSSLRGNYSGLASSDEYGRVSPYVERSFDVWHMCYTKNLDPLDGPLMTDRPHFFKFYGAYTFPFGLTIGSVINAMSGTPITETWSVLGTYWYPFNYGYTREADGSLKKSRTPFLWFSNIYAEYNLKLGKYRLNLNVNVDNLFDIATSRRLYNYRTLTGLAVSEDLVLSKNWDLDTPDINYTQHPRWMMEQDFYPPISVRLGIKFIF